MLDGPPPVVRHQRRARSSAPRDEGGFSEPDLEVPQARRPVFSTLLILVAGAASLIYSARQGVLLGEIAVPILTLGALHGLFRGGFRKILMLGVGIGAFSFIVAHPNFADPVIQRVAGKSSGLANGIVSVVVLGLALTGTALFASYVRRRHIVNRPLALAFDRLVGSGVGLAEGGLVSLALCWIAVMFQPLAVQVRDHADTDPGSIRHQVAAALVHLGDEVQAEPLGEFVDATNLLERTPGVREAIDNLNARGRIDHIEGLDPEKLKKLNELLQRLPAGTSGGSVGSLIEQ